MSQETIGQRLKILIKQLGLDVKGFCQRIDVSETSIRNYFSRGNNPNAEFLTKLTNTFEYVSLHWLLTGNGEPFIGEVPPVANTTTTRIKKVTGGAVHSGTSNQLITLEACQQELENTKRDMASLQRENELMKGQLKDKEEIITLLRASYNRPN